MSRYLNAAALAFFLLMACESSPAADVHVAAARQLTDRYAESRLSFWNVKGSAAGADCSVLLVETAIIMEDAMVEALHYGGGAYDIYGGGVEQFYRDSSFRGVAYRDSAKHLWTYGAVNSSEAESMSRCH